MPLKLNCAYTVKKKKKEKEMKYKNKKNNCHLLEPIIQSEVRQTDTIY